MEVVSVLGLPDGVLLAVLQRLDVLSVLRLSLCSHAAVRRLDGLAHLWRDMVYRALLLRPLSPSQSLPAPSSLPGVLEPQQPDNTTTTNHASTFATAATATNVSINPNDAAVGARHCRQALCAHAKVAFWHSLHCLRLTRVSGGGGGPVATSKEAVRHTVPPRSATCIAQPPSLELSRYHGVGPSSNQFGLHDEELYGLRVCDASDISVGRAAVRTFSVRAAPSGAACKLLVVLAAAAAGGRPFVWLYFPSLPHRPSWQQRHQLLHGSFMCLSSQYHSSDYQHHPHLHNVEPPQQRQQQQQQRLHEPEVWCCLQTLSTLYRDVQLAACSKSGSSRPHHSSSSRSAGHDTSDRAIEATATAAAFSDGVSGAEVAEVRVVVSRIIHGLADAGRERWRCVTALSLASRRKLEGAGIPHHLAAMRSAGVSVVDLAGVLQPPSALMQPPVQQELEGQGQGTQGRWDKGPHATASGQSDGAAGAISEALPNVNRGEAAGKIVRQLRQAEAAGGSAVVSSGSGSGGSGSGGSHGDDACKSAQLRETISQLPAVAPEVQILILPVISPRGGRVVRATPCRGGGIKCTAPRLLQVMVPVLSALRLAMASDYGIIASRAPRLLHLRHVFLLLEDEDEAQEAAIRRIAVSTMDRDTGHG